MLSIIMFTNYPIDVPRHGGQIRSAAIAEVLRRAGWNVKCLSVYDFRNHPEATKDEWHIPVPAEVTEQILLTKGRLDVDASDYPLDRKEVFEAIVNKIALAGAAFFLLEQPWLWPLVKAIKHRLSTSIGVIYSSQNLEVELLTRLLDNVSDAQKGRLIEKARNIENDLVEQAVAVICTSSSDATTIKRTNRNTIVAPNGVWKQDRPTGLDYWEQRFRKLKYMVFIGSAHPPNASGFESMLGPSLMFMPPDQRIVVIGGVCNLITGLSLFTANRGMNETRADFVGVQDAGGLASIISLSQGFILPITFGGGTNLKTAEALYSRRPIVATTTAFRGYEEFASFPNVFIRDDPQEFRIQISAILSDSFRLAETNGEQVELLETLTWPSALKSVEDLLEGLKTRTFPGGSDPNILHPQEPVLARRIPNLQALYSFGWHEPELETGFAWSASDIACLYFPPGSLTSERSVITIEFSSFNPQGEPNSITFLSRSGTLATHENGGGDDATVSLQITDSDLYDDSSLELFIRSIVRTPSDYGQTDVRTLGVRLRHVILGAAGENAPKIARATMYQHRLLEPFSAIGAAIKAGLINSSSTQARFQLDTMNGVLIQGSEIKVANLSMRSIFIRGWALPPSADELFISRNVVVKGNTDCEVSELTSKARPDVARHFGRSELQECGLEFLMPNGLPPGQYKLVFHGTTTKGKTYSNDTYRFIVTL